MLVTVSTKPHFSNPRMEAVLGDHTSKLDAARNFQVQVRPPGILPSALGLVELFWRWNSGDTRLRDRF